MIRRTLQISGKIKCSSVNGPGLRYTLFLSGCPHKCEGCHSPHTWDYNYGKKEDIVDIFSDIYKNRHYIDGVSISGGDPIVQVDNLIPLLKMLKVIGASIWLWTGFKLSFLRDNCPEVLEYTDAIIDGQYVLNEPTERPYRGSNNQRLWVKTENEFVEVKE